MKILASITLTLSIVFASDLARADISKSQCVEADTSGQSLRREGKLSAAKEQFQTCNDPQCPELVRTDCTQRIDEIEQAMPSMLFDVKDAAGNDIAVVRVIVDGKVLTE